MTYTEFYMTQGLGAAANNGGYPLGPDDGPVYESDAITWIDDTHFEDSNGWPECHVGDWAWATDDTNSQSYLLQITAINGNIITTWPAAYFPIAEDAWFRVGGAWSKLSDAMSLLYTKLSSTGLNLRLNVKYEGGTPYPEETTSIAQSSWSYTTPLRVEGYLDDPGDCPWWMTDVRPVIRWSSSAAVNALLSMPTWVTFVNLSLEHMYTGYTNGRVTLNCSSTFLNCILEGKNQGNVNTSLAGTLIRCILRRSQSGVYYAMNTTSDKAKLLHCVICGTGSSYDYGIQPSAGTASIIGCVFRNCSQGVLITGAYPTDIISCTFVNNSTTCIALNNSTALRSVIQNNLFVRNSGFCITSSVSGATLAAPNVVGNRSYNNTSGLFSPILLIDPATNFNLSDDPCVDWENNDFALSEKSDLLNSRIPPVLPEYPASAYPVGGCYAAPGAIYNKRRSVSRSRLIGGV